MKESPKKTRKPQVMFALPYHILSLNLYIYTYKQYIYIYVYICYSHRKITYIFSIPDIIPSSSPNQETTVPRPESSKIARPHVGYASPSRVVHRCPQVRRRPEAYQRLKGSQTKGFFHEIKGTCLEPETSIY